MVFRAVTAAPTAAQDVGSRASLLQHGHIILLKYWNDSRICVSSLSRCYDNLCSNFNIYAAIATTLLLHYTQTTKSVALTNEALLVVVLNYQLFAAQYLGSMARLLLHCHLILLKNQNSSRIFVTSLRRGHANLLFIVPILLYVLLQGTRSENTTHLRGKLYHQQRSLCLWWHETIGNLLLLFQPHPPPPHPTTLQPQMHAASFGWMYLMPGNSRFNCSPAYCLYHCGDAALSLDFAENLEHVTRSHDILVQRPRYFSNHCFDFNICVPIAKTLRQQYTSIPKSFLVRNQTLLVVTLNFRSFAPSPSYHAGGRDTCSRSCLA